MKRVRLTYRNGEREEVLTTNANAATLVERFCHGGKLWIEQFTYRYDARTETEWFERSAQRFTPAENVVDVDVSREDPFDND